MKNLFRYKCIPVLLLLCIPFLAYSKKAKTEKKKIISKSFVTNIDSEVMFHHRRGELVVEYIEGNEARVEATVTIRGEDANDVQTILDAMDIFINETGARTEINTSDNIKYWSTSNNWLWSRHKLVLENGTEIKSKVEQITIDAILYLPKTKVLSLNSKYDDIRIVSCKANTLVVNLRSGTLKANALDSDAHIKVKYGKLDLQYLGDLKLDSHDSQGSIGNVNNLIIEDKYSEIELGNVESLEANLHDSDISLGNVSCDAIINDKYSEIELGNVASLTADLHDSELFLGNVTGDANIMDKYSEIKFGHMENGDWDLHDSQIIIENAGHLKIRTKYTDFEMKDVLSMTLYSHDDDFKINKIDNLTISESKYTDYLIRELNKSLDIGYSHDDDYTVEKSGKELSTLNFRGKYTELRMPLPISTSYNLKGTMKYGDLKYPKDGIDETRYVKDDNDFEIEGKAADGSELLHVKIEAHDCDINLDN